MKMIVGLGNPGKAYARSKHNIGWMVLDEFSKRHQVGPYRLKHEAMIAELKIGSQRVLLVKPLTYMNRSGRAVRSLSDYFKVEPSDILVVVDDIDLAFGTLRIRKSGGSGTHNGMRDILLHLKTEDFPRMRLGIGSEHQGNLADFVLGDFPKAMQSDLDELLAKASDALDDYLKQGLDYSMNRNNG